MAMICNPSSARLGSAASAVSETARTGIRRVIINMKRVVIRRACERACAEICQESRHDSGWLRQSGLTPRDARALAHELRAVAERERSQPDVGYGCNQTPFG
jgi:hypothetical protein